jgi:NhaP-type Na+/H+ or K+/H+ antiporter
MEAISSNNQIIIASLVVIISFFFGELSKKTNIPSVLMLIILGIGCKIALDANGMTNLDFLPVLKVIGIVGLIMIVLEAALELELNYEKLWPIVKALGIALIGLILSTWVAAAILHYYIEGMTMEVAWLYATPLSILSSAIIIPSVDSLSPIKKEFHVYESTFSDILGIMLFYFLIDQLHAKAGESVILGFVGNLGLTIAISFVSSYLLILIFQKISSHAKLFLLISVLLLLYAVGKNIHLSPLIIILIFGLFIGNVNVFFRGKLQDWVDQTKIKEIYEDLHIITIETAFVVRTFFFVIFGISISLASLLSIKVAIISGLVLLSIYAIRFVLLRIMLGSDIVPQLFIAPRGLITVMLFYAIPEDLKFEGFDAGILLFIIISTSIVMTIALIYDKGRKGKAVEKAKGVDVGYSTWKAPSIEDNDAK